MTMLIIDGDTLCYIACKPRWEKKVKVVDGVQQRILGEDGKTLPFEFTPEEDRQYLEESWENFKQNVRDLQDMFYTDEFLMAVKGPNNYRDLMYPEYKLQRKQDPHSIGAVFVPTIRKLAVKEGYAIPSDGREADDLIRIWAEQARAANDDYVICAEDKDLKCIPGRFWNVRKNTMEEITPEMALRHYYEQMLKGDPVDKIPGVPGVGEVKAARILEPFNTEEEFQEQVVDQYMRAYGDDWYGFFLSNAKMIHLQKDLNDYFSCSHWTIIKEIFG